MNVQLPGVCRRSRNSSGPLVRPPAWCRPPPALAPAPRTTSRHPHVAARGQLVRGQPSRSWAGTATVTEPTGSPSASPHAAGRHPDPRNQVLALSTL